MTHAQETHAEVGYYRAKQLGSPSAVVRWTHGARYAKGVALVRELKPGSVLDYGCGDGTFASMIAGLTGRVVAVDNSATQLAECRRVNEHIPNLTMSLVDELPPNGTYDAVFCTEVLEHLIEPDLEVVLSNLHRLASREGHVVVSVPIEIGPMALAKYCIRRALGYFRVGEYHFTEAYSVPEMWKMTFATPATRLPRPVYSSDDGAEYHPHKGFNWKALRARLESRFIVDETTFSPVPWSRGLASSQAWFICRPRK
jgi:SAM-dependent methyltransferase